MDARLSAILSELRGRFEGLFGPRLERLILFGSWARGDADGESDIDVLLVLSDEQEIVKKRERARDIIHELCLEHGVVISCVYTTAETVDRSSMPFYRNVRREGVPI